MKAEDIIRIVESDNPHMDKFFRFDLGTPIPVIGIIVKGEDYDRLKKSNIWRVVTEADIIAWLKTHDLKLTELIHGKLIANISIYN